MKIKNLKIGTQLWFGFAAMFVFVFILGAFSYLMNNQLFKQTETLYSHPMQVTKAVSSLESDVLSMQLGTRDLILAKTDQDKQAAIQMMELSTANALRQFDIFREQYLGPQKDVDEVYNAFINWKTIQEENTKLALAGAVEKVKDNILSTGSVGLYRDQLLAKIKIIDDFAQNKADSLYASSIQLADSLKWELLLIVASILMFTFLIYYLQRYNIRKPLDELTDVTNRFHDGETSARSTFESKNEFGTLSASFNSLAESIQMNLELNAKTAKLAGLMLNENEAKKFFLTTLTALSTHTGSQMAAVYLLDNDKNTFEHFESLGLDNRAKHSFAADSYEGEFGAVLSEKKIIHITQIPDDTVFYFPVVSGRFRPREIITIPILEFNEVIAVVSLASLHGYSGLSLQLVHETWAMLTARINGVLAFKKIIDFSDKLDIQNKELEYQSKEMSMQADELKEYNIELELQKKQLDEANHLKSAFLSNMSHELRTPLNSVIALSGVLNRRLKNQIPEDEFNYLGIIEKNGKQLLDLINDILDLSRIEAGKEEITYSKFTIQDQIKNILESLSPIAVEKGIDVINHIQMDLPPIISDSTKCHHILQNIIGNAIKFTEKGSVEITAEVKAGKFHIGIKDTGIGISQEDLPFIFDEFRQADGKSSRKFGGTGLGLAIAKKYSLLLQGSIEVRSQQDDGSVFVVTLPEKPDGIELNIHEKESQFLKPFASFSISTAQNNGFGKTLLLVEDSEPQIIQLTDILTEEGYILQVARNGKEALEIIQLSVPDALILDLMMPEVDGFEVIKSVRSQNDTKHLPVLILTAKHVTRQELNFLKGNHIYQLIQKGDINRKELLAHVKNMINPPESPVSGNEEKNITEKQIIKDATILLIENNEDSIITVKALLDEKHNLIVASDESSGIKMAKTLSPDLILMDISLPQMDGFIVLQEIKKDELLRNIPVIALTSHAMKGDREDLLSHGFDDYISKPIDGNIFEKTIGEWLRGRDNAKV